MDTIAKINGARIINLIKVVLGDILLELVFNVECMNEKFSFKLGISNDGETIIFCENQTWIALDDITYEAYSALKVDSEKDELSNLLGNEILEVNFGVGKKLYTNRAVIYYIKMNTNKNSFLFFNNGDEGAYSFDKIEAILENDIYGYEWSVRPPFEQLK